MNVAYAIVAAAAVVTALGVLWTKVLHPLLKLAELLQQFMEAFGGEKNPFPVINEIAQEFRTDSGSTLRDLANRLEVAIRDLQISLAASDRLTAEDRKLLAKMAVILELLDTKADVLTLDREDVAEKLRVAQEAVDAVAADLSEAHRRADEVEGPHGAAADAAAQQTAAEKGTSP